MSDWHVFRGSDKSHDGMATFAKDSPPPPWRTFSGRAKNPSVLSVDDEVASRFETAKFQASEKEIEVVNAAIHLRRPLLVTGRPGTGKTTLAYAIAYELQLGTVLTWDITSRSTLQDGLYRYDALARLQEINRRKERHVEEDPNIGDYIRLGPVGTALLPSTYPRVLLIDEIDKSDIDLPNDLLHIFENGRYEIPELTRISATQPTADVLPADSDVKVTIEAGRVACEAFPIVVLTSNGEREFPAPFLRRCVRLNIPEHDNEKLAKIVDTHFQGQNAVRPEDRDALIGKFLERRSSGELSTDQLLNAIYLTRHGFELDNGTKTKEALAETIWRQLGGGS